ncbi:hypothetical protein CXB65_17760 [Pseudomonas monteilii]|uniref:Uncharacterized protein n=1 Tax=Pseudomonas monteilii TaxID=76759 RepID=A0A2N1IPU5_9PSED|nr:hypothetical protein CXB65_17760 [Pseudomonas monteilii]RPD92684.1 hypothetical protein EGN69_22505 [Pseudomonas monteilii]TFW26784.1 hypothetical protein E4L40_00730 [Pseudomonas putida]
MRANALAYGSISRRTNKAVARQWHRMDWPETNVGASLLAMRRAGGARFQIHRKSTAKRPQTHNLYLFLIIPHLTCRTDDKHYH